MDLHRSHRDPEGYQTPSVAELQLLLLENIRPRGPVNQVWPNIYIGNAATARDKATLFNMRITHIVNAAHGPYHINTGARFYQDMSVDYYGVEADDSTDFNLSPFFHPVARFIRAALAQRGKVFVHCAMGVSRSATLVLAYLMICEKLTLVDAINAVRRHRDICPNAGFLDQLRRLERTLTWDREHKMAAYRLAVARDKALLSRLGITHIVNAAAGPRRINTGPRFYADMAVQYRGVEAADHAGFDLRPFFHPTAEFIQTALSQKGTVLVHCGMGISRAPTMVLAYLMICEDLTLPDAIVTVEKHRHCFPNEGFLEQLRGLDTTLSRHRRPRNPPS